jgi:ABC-2 type transport system ATP-binding protein
MEVRLSQAIDGAAGLISDLVRVEERGDDWLRYSTADPRRANPLVLRALATEGVDVLTLSTVPRSLEDVYLRAVSATGSEEETRIVDGKVIDG